MEEFVTVEEARDVILSAMGTVGEQEVFLDRALGQRLAEPISAPEDVPPFDNSSRDGYAVRYDDVTGDPSTRLNVVASVPAGDASDVTVGEGEAARILTGAPVPDGADTVVMQEHVEVDDESDGIVVERQPQERGEWIRPAGEYLKAGEDVFSAGTEVGGAEIGLLGSFGETSVSIHRMPTVAVITAGDELVDIDDVPGPDEILDSNRYQLGALVEQLGAEVVRIPRASDTVVDVRRAFEHAIRAADLVVSVGGVSVGDRDVVRTVIDELTGGLELYRVRMKPGKPLAFGIASNDAATPIIGVPGNPNSCFVCHHQFVRPAIQTMAGAPREQLGLTSFTATLAADTTSTPRRRQYQAGTLLRADERCALEEGETLEHGNQNRPQFMPAGGQASGDPSLFCGKNAFGIVPEGVEQLEAGDPITVELLS